MTDIEALRESLAAAIEFAGYGLATRNRQWIIHNRSIGKDVGYHPVPESVEEITQLYERYLA